MKRESRRHLLIVMARLGLIGILLSSSSFAGSLAPSQHAQAPMVGPVRGSANRPLATVPAKPLAPSVSPSGNCSIGSYALDFGLLASNTDHDVIATGSFAIHCPQGLAVAINAGNGASAVQAHRRMTFTEPGGGIHYLEYQLFTDASGSSIWGTGFAGGRTMNLTGTGTAQTIRIYGRLPAETSVVAVGNYNDTVTITLSF